MTKRRASPAFAIEPKTALTAGFATPAPRAALLRDGERSQLSPLM
jgi:hypothetical protein